LSQLKIFYQEPDRAGLKSVVMDTKKTFRKILFTVTALVAGTGILVLLISAIGEKKKGQCTGYKITVKSLHNNRFIDDKDVFKFNLSETGAFHLDAKPFSVGPNNDGADLDVNQTACKSNSLYVSECKICGNA